MDSNELDSLWRLALSGLDDPDSKLRTALGLILAQIAANDVHPEFKELILRSLLSALQAQTVQPNVIHGAVCCLQNVIKELSPQESFEVC